MKHRVVVFVVLILVLPAIGLWILGQDKQLPIPVNSRAFDKKQYSIDEPSSPWVIVNKQRPLQDRTYGPEDMVMPDMDIKAAGIERYVQKTAAEAIEKLVKDAAQDGMSFTLISGYRSYTFQKSLYTRYIEEQGQTVADTQSARPGYSEHQTGLAIDLGTPNNPECDIEACFEDTKEGQWLAQNSYKYGFVIRYTKDHEAITGYIYEPWHLRYVGMELSQEIHKQGGKTLEEFFGLPPAPNY